MIVETNSHDVMQVCRNGHVITDLLHTYPERGLSHCDRCGAPILQLPHGLDVELRLVLRVRVLDFLRDLGGLLQKKEESEDHFSTSAPSIQ